MGVWEVLGEFKLRVVAGEYIVREEGYIENLWIMR